MKKLLWTVGISTICAMIPIQATAQTDCSTLSAQYTFAQYKVQELQNAINSYNNSYSDRRIALDEGYRNAYNACRSDAQCQRDVTYEYQDQIYELDDELFRYEMDLSAADADVSAAADRMIDAGCF